MTRVWQKFGTAAALCGAALIAMACDQPQGTPMWVAATAAEVDVPPACEGDTPDRPPTAECPATDEDPGATAIDIKQIESRIHLDRHDDRSLQVTIQIDVKQDMPHVAPDLDVKVDCDGHRDDDRAFFMSLNGARKGAELEDRLELFRVHELPEDPKACEYRLQLGTALHPQYWCFKVGETKRGRCKPADEQTKAPEPNEE